MTPLCDCFVLFASSDLSIEDAVSCSAGAAEQILPLSIFLNFISCACDIWADVNDDANPELRETAAICLQKRLKHLFIFQGANREWAVALNRQSKSTHWFTEKLGIYIKHKCKISFV